MSEIHDDKVRELITALCNRAMGQLPEGSFVTMVVRLPPGGSHREEFIITNDREPTSIIAILLKLGAGDHPDVVSDIKVPIEPVRGPITHDPDCPDCKEA